MGIEEKAGSCLTSVPMRQSLFVLYKLQALFAVKGEFGVSTHQSHFVGDGLSNNDMVKGVFMILFLIDMKCGKSSYNINVCVIYFHRRVIQYK